MKYLEHNDSDHLEYFFIQRKTAKSNVKSLSIKSLVDVPTLVTLEAGVDRVYVSDFSHRWNKRNLCEEWQNF